MKRNKKEIHDKLYIIYEKHRRQYKENPDSKQMCCMWSTADPPDIIEGTSPICDMEDTFNISIDEDDCMDLYDMELEEAVLKIIDIMQKK